MSRVTAVLSFVASTSLAIFSNTAFAGTTAHSRMAENAAAMYSAFLNSWSEGGQYSLTVSKAAKLPSAQDTEQYTECAAALGDHRVQWGESESFSDLSKILGKLSYVHFVKAEDWRALDPGRLIAQGESVSKAVSTGVNHSLITLSAITFNKSHTLAMFQFSSTCGSLCGTGHTVVFKKTANGWALQKRTPCGGWMS